MYEKPHTTRADISLSKEKTGFPLFSLKTLAEIPAHAAEHGASAPPMHLVSAEQQKAEVRGFNCAGLARKWLFNQHFRTVSDM